MLFFLGVQKNDFRVSVLWISVGFFHSRREIESKNQWIVFRTFFFCEGSCVAGFFEKNTCDHRKVPIMK